MEQRSLLEKAGATLEISIICHNITAASVRSALGEELIEGVSLREFNDGVYSPAGPKNHALQESQADYLTFVDSDDYVEPGALEAWFMTAQQTGADAVLAPIRTTTGAILTTPWLRPSKPLILDPVRDGLATRSLPFGLLRRSYVDHIGFHYMAGLRTGEDLEPTLRLFFMGGRIAYPYGSSAYCQTDDAGEGRVTAAVSPLEEELAWFAPLAEQRWVRSISGPGRSSIATKLMRIHGIGTLRRRGEIASRAAAGDSAGVPTAGSVWSAEESAVWRAFHEGVKELSGDSLGSLSLRDARLARAALATDDAAGLASAVQAYDSARRWDVLMTENPRTALGRNSIIRHYVNERRRRTTGAFAAPPAPDSPQ
ncbi:hypothetical protein AC792_05555 [Arthrobacter sp. RIT-PI-e]|nr:hypothetical protein AC792_05555 [Arthrobacter sp. RIT-PI-e]